MKKIKLRRDLMAGNEKISSLTILRLVAGSSPQKALSVEDMRRRVRILDALDEVPHNGDVLVLEDEDVTALTEAIEGFPWASANKSILNIIDDVLGAETMAAPKVKLAAQQE